MTAAPDSLAAVHRHGTQLARASWFAAVGEPLTAGERDDAAIYLAGVAFTATPVVGVAGWPQASELLRRPGWDERVWDNEEEHRRRLLRQATAIHGEAALMTALTAVSVAASDLVHGAAAIAATRGGTADETLTRVAAGAATQACYLAALATAARDPAAEPPRANDDDHPFHAKYRLFAGGRWPLTIADDHFYIF